MCSSTALVSYYMTPNRPTPWPQSACSSLKTYPQQSMMALSYKHLYYYKYLLKIQNDFKIQLVHTSSSAGRSPLPPPLFFFKGLLKNNFVLRSYFAVTIPVVLRCFSVTHSVNILTLLQCFARQW